MLAHIPTHLIAGPLGAGKTSLIRQLLADKPADERWAILINEFGQIGLDAALLGGSRDGISLSEVPGGCLCCVNGAPFQVALARLLRQARPDRLLIEPSGLGHPAQLLEQLRDSPWQQVLAVQPPVLVLDAAALARGETLADSQADSLPLAGLVLLNKQEQLDAPQRAALQQRFAAYPLHWTSQGQLPFSALPGHQARAGEAADASLPDSPPSSPGLLWRDPHHPLCQYQQQEAGWSIGWRWHPSQRFELAHLQHWLQALPWRRAKLLVHSNAGWLSANALAGQPLHWQASEWRRDSRIELIFREAQALTALQEGLAACRLESPQG